MNYRNVATLNQDILSWAKELPRDIELIVGVPRSGLLAANLLALHMDLPLTDLEGLIEGRVFKSGKRNRFGNLETFLDEPRNVLIVDDSEYTGRAITSAKETINSAGLNHHIQYAVVYAADRSKSRADYICKELIMPQIFEWNLINHYHLKNTCMDIDGVFCQDPTREEDDDGEKYRQYLINTPPLLYPKKTIGWLVTCRLEKYRDLTEQWFERHGITYNKLIMMDYPDLAARVAAGRDAAYKAEVYKKTNALLFIESSLNQAEDIARITGKQVLCTETNELIEPGGIKRQMQTFNRNKHLIFKDPLRFAKKLPGWLVKEAKRLYQSMESTKQS